ncbi:amino acid racemase [Alteromonas sp. ASW11-19]|uniref:Amino acid racemase n=1 Tax=Alteromonas salexigens TaxID=2982530 RepID=A0ABT2VIZ8_9ALTE|nr:amino acid racemase [Alteromonas salexigens]MCU7553165.1 amino acid racemase [Alteromonas salexigens]
MGQQRRCGIIGGMSWESTLLYYQHINRLIGERLGGLHSADLLIHSVDFEPIAHLQHANDWAALGKQLATSARALQLAGAEGIAIATNTMHYVASDIIDNIDVPLLHIGDAAATACRQQNVKRVGLLDTTAIHAEAIADWKLETHAV